MQFEKVTLDWRTFGEADTAHISIKIWWPHDGSIQSIARRILKLNKFFKMFKPFSLILRQIRLNLTQNCQKFAIGIMEM